MMDEKRFDELWERAEAGHYADDLAAEYPAWRTRRRRIMGIAALVLVVGASLPLLPTGSQPQTKHEGYTMAYCNRANISDQYWVDMADELLRS